MALSKTAIFRAFLKGWYIYTNLTILQVNCRYWRLKKSKISVVKNNKKLAELGGVEQGQRVRMALLQVNIGGKFAKNGLQGAQARILGLKLKIFLDFLAGII